MKAAIRKKLRPSWPDNKPPWKPEFSDGCTLVPDAGTLDCCLAHDKAYYEAKGGRVGRRRADRAYLDCMRAHGWTWRARFRWAGVRAFGWIFWYT